MMRQVLTGAGAWVERRFLLDPSRAVSRGWYVVHVSGLAVALLAAVLGLSLGRAEGAGKTVAIQRAAGSLMLLLPAVLYLAERAAILIAGRPVSRGAAKHSFWLRHPLLLGAALGTFHLLFVLSPEAFFTIRDPQSPGWIRVVTAGVVLLTSLAFWAYFLHLVPALRHAREMHEAPPRVSLGARVRSARAALVAGRRELVTFVRDAWRKVRSVPGGESGHAER